MKVMIETFITAWNILHPASMKSRRFHAMNTALCEKGDNQTELSVSIKCMKKLFKKEKSRKNRR